MPQADEYGNYGDLEGAARDFVRKFGVTAGDDLENLTNVLGEGASKLQGQYTFLKQRMSDCSIACCLLTSPLLRRYKELLEHVIVFAVCIYTKLNTLSMTLCISEPASLDCLQRSLPALIS